MGRNDGIAKRRQQSAARWWQGVAVPHSSLEAGDGPSGPRGAKGAPRCGQGVGTTPRTPSLTSVSPRNDLVVGGTANPQRDEPDASLTGTSGSVGALGGNSQGDPAQDPQKTINSV